MTEYKWQCIEMPALKKFIIHSTLPSSAEKLPPQTMNPLMLVSHSLVSMSQTKRPHTRSPSHMILHTTLYQICQWRWVTLITFVNPLLAQFLFALCASNSHIFVLVSFNLHLQTHMYAYLYTVQKKTLIWLGSLFFSNSTFNVFVHKYLIAI